MQTRSEAQAALDRLREEKRRAVEELAEAREVLDSTETNSGDALLAARLAGDETAAEAIREKLNAARLGVAEGEKIVAACDRSIWQADRDVLAAEAAELREEVRRRWPEVRDRIAATQKILDELAALEGCRFWPGPQPLPSGACPEGSMMRTATGRLMVEIADLELRATVLETRSGLTPSPSIMADVLPSEGWHFGNPGVLVCGPITVHGDDRIGPASAALMGKPVPPPFTPTVEQLVHVKLGGELL